MQMSEHANFSQLLPSEALKICHSNYHHRLHHMSPFCGHTPFHTNINCRMGPKINDGIHKFDIKLCNGFLISGGCRSMKSLKSTEFSVFFLRLLNAEVKPTLPTGFGHSILSDQPS